ncbi:MAG: CapA family protein [Bacteriovoracaceae bacterium]|nr:CapA family protein [Bacteriovoracaceae bacterium]
MKKNLFYFFFFFYLTLFFHLEASFGNRDLLLSAYDFSVIENAAWYSPQIPTNQNYKYTNINKDDNPNLDIRGVGDSAWAQDTNPQNGSRSPANPNFNQSLINSNPSLLLFRGDLSFMNLETTIAEYCEKKRMSVDFYFISHPGMINQLAQAGFNVFGLANNHCQDCQMAKSLSYSTQSLHGPLATLESMNRKERELKENYNIDILWAGVNETTEKKNPFDVKLKKFFLKNKWITVAFGSVAVLSWDIMNAAIIKSEMIENDVLVKKLMKNFDQQNADIKILSIHTQDSSGHMRSEGWAVKKLKKIAEDFINQHDGTVVFGHGPHTFAGVKAIKKKNNKIGVIFTSLGNFIHPGLQPGSDNLLGRALVNPDTFSVEEVNMIPLINRRTKVDFYSQIDQTKNKIHANFKINVTTQ